MILVQEILNHKLAPLKEVQRENLRQLRAFVEQVTADYFDPATAPTSVVIQLSALTDVIHDSLESLQQWAVPDMPEITEFVSFVESQLEKTIDKFWAWSDRKIISVQEAAITHNRSRSTIYRWIKRGKLNAQKISNRWCIAS